MYLSAYICWRLKLMVHGHGDKELGHEGSTLRRAMCVSVCAASRRRQITRSIEWDSLPPAHFPCPLRVGKKFGELIGCPLPLLPPSPCLPTTLARVVRVQVKAFFEANPVPNNARKLSQMLESMEINVRFFKTVADSPLSTDAFWEGLEM